MVAVDGKTARCELDDDGDPLRMLNVFVHDLQAVVGQWSTGAEKTNEPTLPRRHLAELLDAYPMLRLFTGDAIFAQRPLAELIRGRGYLPQVKAHQGETLDALQNCFAQARQRRVRPIQGGSRRSPPVAGRPGEGRLHRLEPRDRTPLAQFLTLQVFWQRHVAA